MTSGKDGRSATFVVKLTDWSNPRNPKRTVWVREQKLQLDINYQSLTQFIKLTYQCLTMQKTSRWFGKPVTSSPITNKEADGFIEIKKAVVNPVDKTKCLKQVLFLIFTPMLTLQQKVGSTTNNAGVAKSGPLRPGQYWGHKSQVLKH